MNELSTKVKNKLNIFQRMRLLLFKRQKFDIKRYAKAPKYIQDDDFISSHIIYYPENWTYEDLSLIPTEKLVDFIEHNGELMKVFPENEKMNFIMQNPNIIHSISQDSLIELLDYAIITGNNSFIEILHGNEQAARNYLYHLKDIDKLSDVLPNILRYMDQQIIEQILSNRIDLISNLTREQQLSYVVKKPELIQCINTDLQKEIIKEYPDYIKMVSNEVKEEFILNDKSNLAKMDDEYQIETITKFPNAYQYASENLKIRIYKDIYDSKCVFAMKSLLKKDINNARFLNIRGLLNELNGYEPVIDLFKDINLEDSETIKNFFINTGIMSAKGKLLSSDTVLHGCSPERTDGIDGYKPSQISIIQSLDTNQIQELIEIDSNYILPYLTGSSIQTITKEEAEVSKVRCKKIFANMFGEEKLNELDSCIDLIYSMQLKEQVDIEQSAVKATGGISLYDTDIVSKLKRADNIPLNYFKLLFNRNIITLNSVEKIKNYFDKLEKSENISQEFSSLMQNAYGDYTREILSARPDLNIHTINSLEIFDNNITNNFEVGFVHDLLSYNIRDFSSFLSVVKDTQRLENFKLYYDVLSKVMGKNVETMQKAISEYMFNEDLLNNIRDIDLTDEQYQNLISVMLSNKNRYNIRNIDDLSNYDEIAKNSIKNKLLKINNEPMPSEDNRIEYLRAYRSKVEKLKACICEEFLGLDFSSNYFSKNYGDSFLYLTSLFDMQDEVSRTEMYSEEEFAMLNVINFLDKEENLEKLMELANNLLTQEKINNPINLQSGISKMKEHQIEIFNQSLLTVEKMEQLCMEQEENEKPLIKKEKLGNIPIYKLQGIPFNILLHNTYGMTLDDYINYDGQLGNNAICSRNISERNIADGKIQGSYGYTSIETDGGIISNSGKDASTNHLPKLVRGTGAITIKINKHINSSMGETAFYRRYRNHDRITNENHGGKRLPDVYVVYSERAVTKENLRDVIKKGIPIVYIDLKSYKTLNQQKEFESQRER